MTKRLLLMLLKHNMYSIKIVNKLFAKYKIHQFTIKIHRESGYTECSIFIELIWEDNVFEANFTDKSIVGCWDKFIKYFKKLGLL